MTAGLREARVRRIGILVLAMGMTTVCGGVDDGWDVYANARFGFNVCYPRALLKPRGEPTNGDGNTFRSKDGQVTVVAYGMYGLDPEAGKTSMQVSFRIELERLRKDGFAVTYQVQKPHLYAFSGVADAGSGKARVRYEKTVERQDRQITLEANYPAAMQSVMDPVVARMAGCLFAAKTVDD